MVGREGGCWTALLKSRPLLASPFVCAAETEATPACFAKIACLLARRAARVSSTGGGDFGISSSISGSGSFLFGGGVGTLVETDTLLVASRLDMGDCGEILFKMSQCEVAINIRIVDDTHSPSSLSDSSLEVRRSLLRRSLLLLRRLLSSSLWERDSRERERCR